MEILTNPGKLFAIKCLINNFFFSVLLCATYHVATHPDIQQKVYDEIKTVLGDGNVDGANMDKLV